MIREVNQNENEIFLPYSNVIIKIEGCRQTYFLNFIRGSPL